MKTNKNTSSFKLSLAAVAVASVAAPLIMITGSAGAGVDSGHFWVKAQDSENPQIKAFAGINGTGKTEVENPGGENPGGGDPETPDTGTGEIKVATYTCGPTELKVTQAMVDHSKKNRALLDAGKASEMEPYPDGGWNVIIDVSNVDPSLSGVLLSSDGAINFSTTTNSSGPSAIFKSGETCNMHGVVDGEYHSTDGPAQVTAVGDVVTQLHYMVNNQYHRVGSPAKILNNTDGSKQIEEWYIDGKKHREDGPALSKWNGDVVTTEEWYLNGKLHRADGPAITKRNADGSIISEEWYVNGERHRVGAPAKIVHATPHKAQIDIWYLDDKHYRSTTYDVNTGKPSQDEWLMPSQDDEWGKGIYNRHRVDGPAIVSYNEDGSISTEEYWQDNQKHRDGAPAQIYYNTSGEVRVEAWYQHGELHREGAPAQSSYQDSGHESYNWYLNGKKHRLDGPAEYTLEKSGDYMEGQQRWFIDGVKIDSKDQLLAAGGDATNWPDWWG